MRRINSWSDVMATGLLKFDAGDGLVTQIPVGGPNQSPAVQSIADLPEASSSLGQLFYVISESLPYFSDGVGWQSINEGARGPAGPAGDGVPEGGLANQVLRKNSSGSSSEWVSLSKTLVGLSNVDNTADADKPISIAVSSALAGKADKSTILDELSGKADKASTLDELSRKADLQSGKVPVTQLPVDALVTDTNVAAQVNGAQTGAAIDARITTQATPLVQPIVADYIASSQVVVDAAAAAVDASPALAEKMPLSQGQIPAGGDANNYNRRQHSGPWGVASSVDAATIANLPVPLAGTLIVDWIAGTLSTGRHLVAQMYIAFNNGGFFYRTSISQSSGSFSAWVRLDKPPEAVAAILVASNADLDTYWGNNYRGRYYIPSEAVAQTVAGLPDGVASVANLDVLTGPPGYGYTTQLLFTAGAGAAFYWRTMLTGSSFSEWSKVGAGGGGGAGDPFEPVAVGMNNADLLAEMEQRKGGSIGTSGRAAFALRFDHGTNAYRDFLGPLLKQFGLPSTMAVYSKQNEVNTANHSVPWEQVAGWHHSHGMSFGNHSDDHLDKPGAEGWQGGTIGSLAELKNLMPSVPIEQYIPHGSVGYERYGGFNQANSNEAIVGTLAGRMALSSHALIAGYRGGRYRPLHGKPMQGLTHWSMEESTPAVFKTMVDGAISRGSGLAVMFHPEFIGLNGKMTWAEVEECLEYVAQKRDEGLILPLTLDGLAFADMRSDYRDDLINKAEALMQDTSKIYGNFTETPGAFASSTSGQYVRHLANLGNREWAKGGTRCAEWKVSSTAGANVTVRVQESTDTPPWFSEQTVTVPAGESVVYLPFGIPLDAAASQLRVEITLNSGDLTINETHTYAI